MSDIRQTFNAVLPAVDFCSLRLVRRSEETLHLRQDVLQPLSTHDDQGAFITVYDRGGFGYAATSDLSVDGLRQAVQAARSWAVFSRDKTVVSADKLPRPTRSGRYVSTVERPWDGLSLSDRITLLHDASEPLKISKRIVDWQSMLQRQRNEVLLLTSEGIEIEQIQHVIASGVQVIAADGGRTQQRSGCGWGYARQGGLEQVTQLGFPGDAEQVAEEALALLDAGECPAGTMDVLLQPSQMMLQIHESIGHPLELDRILGDERNYAGRSFVSMDMFGAYRYGSDLLNVTFDPTVGEELASYAFDDDGTAAERVHLIRDGILERPLGGAHSQARAGMSGTANARATNWNRPPIDRMANLNLEPGNSAFDELVASIENGVLMDTNQSWSIDDSRNKFQFGCEYGRLIKDGQLGDLVRNPNYRGISATFWRNLAGVGDASTYDILGTPYCGKGEPNQVIQVGHASPACVFRDIEVFGGM